MHLLRVLRQNRLNIIGSVRCISDGKPKNDTDPPFDSEHPFYRTGRLLKRDLKNVKNFILPEKKIIGSDDEDIRDIRTRANDEEFQSHCDVLVIGGGGVGASIAYWLKKRGRDGVNVVVLEKDPTVSIHGYLFVISYTEQFVVTLFCFMAVPIGFNNSISRWTKATIFARREHSNELVCCRLYARYKRKPRR